jgi:hypothetical protein
MQSTRGPAYNLFCPEAKNSSPLFKFIEFWEADLIEWGAILVEVNFYHSLSDGNLIERFMIEQGNCILLYWSLTLS